MFDGRDRYAVGIDDAGIERRNLDQIPTRGHQTVDPDHIHAAEYDAMARRRGPQNEPDRSPRMEANAGKADVSEQCGLHVSLPGSISDFVTPVT